MPLSDHRDRILIVDDAPEFLSLLTDIFERNGMTALVAQSGPAALKLLERITPDVILMDAVMPEMDGFEACREIKRRPGHSLLPIIFMTGLAESEHVVKAFEAGGVDYVTKPISPDEIIVRIRTHLKNSRLARSARVALDISGRTLTAVDETGAIRWSTPQASALIRSLQGNAHARVQDLWATFQPQLAQVVAERRRDATLVETEQGKLKASFLGEANPGEYLLSLTDGQGPGDAAILMSRLDLTAREAEVLLWIAQGKSNRDIAEILDCSHRTVNKHLEQIFVKLHVENRTAAAAIAIRMLVER